MRKMTKRNNIYSVLAFVFSVIAAGLYADGIYYIINDEYYAYAWLTLIGLFPIAILLITSLFADETKNTRKIPVIISASLLVVGLIDCLSGKTMCLPMVKVGFFYAVFGTPVPAKYLTYIFTYVVFALIVFFVPLCKPIWTKLFCIIEAVLNLFYISYFAVLDYIGIRSSDYCISVAYILFYIGFFFISCTMSKDYNKDYEEEPKRLDYTPFFKSGAYLEIAHDTAEKNHIDYASFYEFIKKSDFESIKEKGYYGHDFALQMIVDLHDIFEVLINDNSSFELILLKQKTDELYNIRNDLSAFDLKFFLFLHFLSNANEEDLKAIAVDISSKSEFPINMLSNFASNSFTLDGVNIASMEGFLQSLKYKDTDAQRRICALTGNEAKKAGKRHNFWKITQVLYWNGNKINRYSSNYTNLITRAYDAMAESNPVFVKILLSTGYKVLVHSVGKEHKWQTVLTEDEFKEEQLVRLRIKYREAKDGE